VLDLEPAVSALRQGGLVVYPTETLYGIGADATSDAALARLVLVKGREAGKAVSVLVDSRAMLDDLVDSVSPVAEKLMRAFWPGPLTLAFAAKRGISPILTGGGDTIAARISSHPLARALVERLGRPLTSTSANPSGAEPALDVAAARGYFGGAIDAYVDGGRVSGGAASSVVDCSRAVPRLVRAGAIGEAEIAAAAGMRLERG